MTTRNLAEKLGNILVECTLDNPLNFSSHDLLLTVLSIPAAKAQDSKYSETYEDFYIDKVLWKSSDISKYQEYAGSLLSKAESSFPDAECIPMKCELYSTLLVNAALSTCDIKKPSLKSNSKPRLSKKIKSATSHYKIKYKDWNNQQRSKDHPTYQAYLSAKRDMNVIYHTLILTITLCKHNPQTETEFMLS